MTYQGLGEMFEGDFADRQPCKVVTDMGSRSWHNLKVILIVIFFLPISNHCTIIQYDHYWWPGGLQLQFFHIVRNLLLFARILPESYPGCRQIQNFVKEILKEPSAGSHNQELQRDLSNTFRITKKFHVAMLPRYKGFWDFKHCGSYYMWCCPDVLKKGCQTNIVLQ